MDIYINGTVRPDIQIAANASLEQDDSHTTASTVLVELPLKSAPPKECDAIRLAESNATIFAGVIMKVTQSTVENVDLNYRQYTLDLSNNSDLIATTLTNLQFPAGANISQILLGNHPEKPYYSSSLPEFYGVLEVRVVPEGISLGTIDDFTFATLDSPANLWGQLVIECLNTLAGYANAWWEITNDKVFNMRSNQIRSLAPANLDNKTDFFNVSVSRDALTLYSAVRIIGGKAALSDSALFDMKNNNGEPGRWDNWVRTSDTVLTSNVPLNSIESIVQGDRLNMETPEEDIPYNVRVGYKGLHDDDPSYQALMSYGGTEVELKDGYKWIDLTQYPFPPYDIFISGISYLIDINTRLVDEQAAASIRSQRGGTGIIEYVMEDPEISTLADAALAGEAFLSQNSQRAVTISFETFIPGWAVGQILTANAEYYELFGTYKVTKVSSVILGEYTSGPRWKYSIEASSIDYRDPYKKLFNKPQKLTFSLDSGYAPADGIYADNQVNLQTYVNAFISTPVTWQILEMSASSWEFFQEIYPSWSALQMPTNDYIWSDIEKHFSSWTSFQKYFTSWAVLQNIAERWYFLGNYLTDVGRKHLLNILSGNGQDGDLTNLNLTDSVFVDAAGSSSMLAPEQISTPSNNSITAVYYLAPDSFQNIITSLQYLYGGSGDDAGKAIMRIPVNIDRSPNNPQGQYALTISVRHMIV